ncbi:LLM class flavin-dependent oxidoreductase [Kocuria sediminis]|uniref:LLM class flavin-dependent oxidoreductase n=1 Tax=Kocuria sediminis TaxID=1038857 RepID=A0A6N8GGI4_9MICC|nr:LLM class flavin-dependent oxidoreductase [Kocuria sediminis]MUN62271.1 LLM class flavin-dependent oxidoreductase [Kocuria sediminis]
MEFEIGIFSLGEVVQDPVTGARPDTRQRLGDMIEQAEAAERAGLTVMGVGENHGTDVVAASPVVLLSAIAGRTSLLRLTTAVSVLTAGNPVQLYEQIAMLDNISGGRAEMVVGRGASARVLRALGLEGQDHDALFEQKLLQLLELLETNPSTFDGRLAGREAELDLQPRPLQARLPVWVGSSGTLHSVVRAGVLGLPLALLRTHGPLADALPAVAAYRQALEESGRDTGTPVSLNVPGFVARTPEQARELSYPYFAAGARSHGPVLARDPRWTREEYDRQCAPEGSLVVGDVDEVVAKIVAQQQALGHGRLLLRMDAGGVPHRLALEAITLLGTEVVPRVRAALC